MCKSNLVGKDSVPLERPKAALCRAVAIFLTLGLWLTVPVSQAGLLDTSDDYWALLAGYGQSFPGWGLTEERVHSFDLVPRYSHLTIDDIGSGWLAGRHDTFVELPLHFVTGPDTSAMVGVNLLAAYTFTAHPIWQPYVFGGGGILYSFADIPGMGADWNGNYQFAGGLRRVLDDPMHALIVEVRYHHISNAGTKDPNEPLNSIKLLIGYTF